MVVVVGFVGFGAFVLVLGFLFVFSKTVMIKARMGTLCCLRAIEDVALAGWERST